MNIDINQTPSFLSTESILPFHVCLFWWKELVGLMLPVLIGTDPKTDWNIDGWPTESRL